MRIYLSALSVHRAEQRANIVFTHTHGFAMQIIWYYCTYSTQQRGSSVTGTASTLLSFLHPLAEYLFARCTHPYIPIRCIEIYPVITASSKSRVLFTTIVFSRIDQATWISYARILHNGVYDGFSSDALRMIVVIGTTFSWIISVKRQVRQSMLLTVSVVRKFAFYGKGIFEIQQG